MDGDSAEEACSFEQTSCMASSCRERAKSECPALLHALAAELHAAASAPTSRTCASPRSSRALAQLFWPATWQRVAAERYSTRGRGLHSLRNSCKSSSAPSQ